MKVIDIKSWNRKEHFEFFSAMASPYFGFTTEVECTMAYKKSREKGHSFFAAYLHASMIAVNAIEEMKLRILDDNVVLYDIINAGTTIGRADGTFGFAYVRFSEDFNTFNTELQKEIAGVQNSTGIRMNNGELGKDLIRHSAIPWNSFSAILHPTPLDRTESVPKITFGKFTVRNGNYYLPVSVEAHHGLADGFHLAKYLEEFQKQLAQ